MCVQTTFVAEPFVTVLEDKKVPETRCVLTASAVYRNFKASAVCRNLTASAVY